MAKRQLENVIWQHTQIEETQLTQEQFEELYKLTKQLQNQNDLSKQRESLCDLYHFWLTRTVKIRDGYERYLTRMTAVPAGFVMALMTKPPP